VTLFIRKSHGITSLLACRNDLLTLLDGPYPGCPTKAILECDRALLICGGIGITAIFPWAYAHANAKLAWSVRESAAPLVDTLIPALNSMPEKDVRIGRRLEIDTLLDGEARSGWHKVGVVVCRLPGMCDNARALVSARARSVQGAAFELEVHAYSW
jgi:hypothetical protein